MRGPCSPGAWEASGRGLQAQAVYRNHGPHPWLPNVYLSKRHLPTKVHLVKAMVFPVVMYGCVDSATNWLSEAVVNYMTCGVYKR